MARYVSGTPFAKEMSSVVGANVVLNLNLVKNWNEMSSSQVKFVMQNDKFVKESMGHELESTQLNNPTGALVDRFYRQFAYCRNTKQSVGAENQTCEILDEVILLDFSVYEKVIISLIENEDEARSFCSSYLTFSWVKDHFSIGSSLLDYKRSSACAEIRSTTPSTNFFWENSPDEDQYFGYDGATSGAPEDLAAELRERALNCFNLERLRTAVLNHLTRQISAQNNVIFRKRANIAGLLSALADHGLNSVRDLPRQKRALERLGYLPNTVRQIQACQEDEDALANAEFLLHKFSALHTEFSKLPPATEENIFDESLISPLRLAELCGEPIDRPTEDESKVEPGESSVLIGLSLDDDEVERTNPDVKMKSEKKTKRSCFSHDEDGGRDEKNDSALLDFQPEAGSTSASAAVRRQRLRDALRDLAATPASSLSSSYFSSSSSSYSTSLSAVSSSSSRSRKSGRVVAKKSYKESDEDEFEPLSTPVEHDPGSRGPPPGPSTFPSSSGSTVAKSSSNSLNSAQKYPGIDILSAKENGEVERIFRPYLQKDFQSIFRFGSKLSHLAQYLDLLGAQKHSNSRNRILIFSQFQPMLTVIARILDIHNIGHVTCQGQFEV